MKRRSLSLLLVFGVCLPLGAAAFHGSFHTKATSALFRTADPVFSHIDAIVQSLSSITGLSEKHPVSYGRMNKRQLRQFLTKRIRKTLKPEEIKADELALKMLGFVPQDFDLRKSTMDLLTEQAAAFYDYDEKRLFLMEDSAISGEDTTLAHELGHALVDQHFNLSTFMDEKPSSDDENLAHSAVVEGEASWLMIAYNLKQSGAPPEPTREMLSSVVDSSSAATSDYPVLSDAPPYIRQSLLFPYAEGTAFFDAVYRKFGKRAFSLVFTDPPNSSSQIIHPERYFTHEQPTHPLLPEVRGLSDDEITSGSLGEFDHQMLLRQPAGKIEAAELASHLRGSQFQLAADKNENPVLRYVSDWDSSETAVQFLALYAKILSGKWEHFDLTLRDPRVLAGTGDNGLFISRVQGQVVTSIEGLRDPREWERLKSLPSFAPPVAKLH